MNIVTTLPQTEADFFDEKGQLKENKPPVQQQQIGSMFVLRKIQDPNNAILLSEDGIEIQHNTSTSVSESDPDPVPDPIPTPDFPFQEFPLTEVVKQSQIDFSSISDMADPRECSNSTKKAPTSTDSSLKTVQNCSSNEELREIRDPTVSTASTQSLRDSNTISIPDNSNPGKSIPGKIPEIIPGIMTDTPYIPKAPEKIQSVMPTDIQALTVLQDLISDDFQENTRPDTHSTQRKGEDETFQLIQKIHNQLQQVQWDLQRLHSLHKYKN